MQLGAYTRNCVQYHEVYIMKHINEIYPKSLSECSCLNIRRASRAVNQYYDKVVKQTGLTVLQLSLLHHLDITKQTTISELAKIMRIDRTALNRKMKPLVDAELIAIKPGKDLRTREIILTEAGKDAIVEGWTLWGDAQTALKEYMGEEDMAKLDQLLLKLEAIMP